VKSFLMSWLGRQHASDDLESFARALPGPWLVWEAGPWRPPPADRATLLAASREGRNSSGDALVLEVAPRVGRAKFEGVRLGRGPENDLVVDDGTLSRAHMLLRREGDAWTVEDLRSSNGTQVDGKPIQGERVLLAPGARIEAGSVRLTFYDARGLYLRLRHGVL
jgi:pSer/pThr/pTyr-binding forkhead associated (FHA) protein